MKRVGWPTINAALWLIITVISPALMVRIPAAICVAINVAMLAKHAGNRP